jgi:branched-chain amino acid transport system permease protein
MHPQFMLLGALLYTSFYKGGYVSFVWAVGLSMVLVTALAAAIYVLIVDRAAALPHWVQMILTLGLSICSIDLIQLRWGSNLRFLRLPLTIKVWHIPADAVVTNMDVAVLVTGSVLAGVLFWLLTKSPLAYRLDATAADPTLAAYSGISLRFWFAVAWAIAAAAAVIGGIAYSTRIPVDTSLIDVGLLAFPAAMLGGMDSIHGAFIGAFILAVIQQFGTLLVGSEVSTAIAFSLVVLVLVFRPRGLFGSPVVERV